MVRDKIRRKRYGLARSLERAAVPERPHFGRGPRYLVLPEITMACAPSLLAIAAALRDGTHTLDEGAMDAVRSFISDGGSPFYGRDATAAMREAVALQHAVIAPRPVVPANAQKALAESYITNPSPALTGS